MKRRKLNTAVSLLSAGVMASVSTLSAFPQTFAEDVNYKVTDDYFKYEVNEGDTITILGRTDGDYDKDKLIIPSEIEGKPVTVIGENAFWFSDYSEVVFPDTLIEIGESAFISSDLESVELPDSVKKIGNKAFRECSDITTVKLTPFIEEIGSSAFSYADSLEYVYIPDMPALNTDDGLAAWFFKCGLKKAELEDGITRLPTYLFSDCEDLTELIWSDDLEVIGNNTFAGCGFTEMIIPESVTEIRDFAFKNCTFTELTLPKGLKIIGNSAFSDCDYVTNIDIPPEVEEIGDTAFGYMDSLEELYVPNIPAVQNNKFYNTLYHSGLKKIQFADDIAVIPEYMCSGCEALEEIVWSDSLEEIGNYGFANCISLKDPKLPEGLKKLGKYAFSYCTGIENVDLPLSIEELGYRPFEHTDSLKYLYVPKQFPSTSGEYAGGSAFMDSGIEKLVFADGITEINDTFSDLPELTEVVIPDSVTKLDHHAFDGCSSLSEINLPKNLKEIEWIGTFGGCDNLREIKIPASVEKASYFGSPVLEIVEFEEGMTKIPDRFTGSDTLRKVIIPDSVTEIGESAFSGCKNLSIIEGADNENLAVGYDAFSNCNNLWDSRFSYFERGGLTIQKSVRGDVENYTVHYSINPKFRDDFVSAKFDSYIEFDVDVIEESLATSDFEIGYRSLKHDITEPEGTFYFSVSNPQRRGYAVQYPSFSINTKKGTVNIQPNRGILTNAEKSSAISLTVPKNAVKTDGTSTFNVYGNTLLDKEVQIYLNGELYTTVSSSKFTGKYSTNITYSGDADSVKVWAVWEDVKTDEYTVVFNDDMPEVVSVYFGHDNTHNYVHEDITDIFRDGYSPYIPFNPSMPVDFEVELSDNDNTDRLYVVSETDGEYSPIELKYDETSNTWKGEGFFSTPAPGNISITSFPKEIKDTLVVTQQDDSISYKYKNSGVELGGDIMIPDENGNEYDPIQDFIDNTDTKVVGYSEKEILVRSDLRPMSDEIPDDSCNINVYEGELDKIWLDGEYRTPKEIAENPEKYGFSLSPVGMIDVNGEYSQYIVRNIGDSDIVKDITSKITLEGLTDFGLSATETVSDFLFGAPISTSLCGTIAIKLGADEEDTKAVCTFTNEYTKAASSTLLTGALTESLKGVSNSVASVGGFFVSVGSSYYDVQNHSNRRYMRYDQLYYSKNPDVIAHRDEIKAAINTAYAGRVVCAAAPVGVGAVMLVAGTAFFPATLIGLGVFAATYLVGQYLDEMDAENDARLFSGYSITPDGRIRVGFDPSGYAYGKNKDDRIEGATATIYYKDENGEAVKWNAEDYDQKNPQITDSAGWYAWDVPEGEWKVVLEKEGYKTTESEWLHVLPVQTDVNLQLKSINEPDFILGDVDGDGTVSAMDASAALTYYVMQPENIEDLGFPFNENAADWDGNGIINAIDASAILTYYVSH